MPRDTDKTERLRQLKKKWSGIEPGMTLSEVEKIVEFYFNPDSENKAGRMVYSHHTFDYLPFYILIDKVLGKVVREHNIYVLDEL